MYETVTTTLDYENRSKTAHFEVNNLGSHNAIMLGDCALQTYKQYGQKYGRWKKMPRPNIVTGLPGKCCVLYDFDHGSNILLVIITSWAISKLKVIIH
jgi:hypothetical protein